MSPEAMSGEILYRECIECGQEAPEQYMARNSLGMAYPGGEWRCYECQIASLEAAVESHSLGEDHFVKSWRDICKHIDRLLNSYEEKIGADPEAKGKYDDRLIGHLRGIHRAGQDLTASYPEPAEESEVEA